MRTHEKRPPALLPSEEIERAARVPDLAELFERYGQEIYPTPVLLQATLSALCGTPIVSPRLDPGFGEHTEDSLVALESAFKSVPTL